MPNSFTVNSNRCRLADGNQVNVFVLKNLDKSARFPFHSIILLCNLYNPPVIDIVELGTMWVQVNRNMIVILLKEKQNVENKDNTKDYYPKTHLNLSYYLFNDHMSITSLWQPVFVFLLKWLISEMFNICADMI